MHLTKLHNKESREPGLGDTVEVGKLLPTHHLSDNETSKKVKDCKLAITIYRTNTRTSWGDISSRKLESTIKRKSEVFPVAMDRAIFWCLEEQEFKGLLLKPDQLSSYKTYVKMERWSKEIIGKIYRLESDTIGLVLRDSL